MFAAHQDQENLLVLRQGSSKNRVAGQNGLAPTTPGYRYPKTPIRVPPKDENAFAGGKGALRDGTAGKGNLAARSALVTPMGVRRAPLGNKSTNTRAKAARQIAVSEAAAERVGWHEVPSLKPGKFSPRLVHETAGANPEARDAADESEPEYAPPTPAEKPYESDVFPNGCLTMDGLKRENLFRGYFQHFHNPCDDDGVCLAARKLMDETKAVWDRADEEARKQFEELDWSVSDIPETRTRPAKKSGTAPAPSLDARRGRSRILPSGAPGASASAGRAVASAARPPSATKGAEIPGQRGVPAVATTKRALSASSSRAPQKRKVGGILPESSRIYRSRYGQTTRGVRKGRPAIPNQAQGRSPSGLARSRPPSATSTSSSSAEPNANRDRAEDSPFPSDDLDMAVDILGGDDMELVGEDEEFVLTVDD